MCVARDRQRPAHGSEWQRRVEVRKVLAARRRMLPSQMGAKLAVIDRDQHKIVGAGIVPPQRLRELGRGREMDEPVGAILRRTAILSGAFGLSPFLAMRDLEDQGHTSCASGWRAPAGTLRI